MLNCTLPSLCRKRSSSFNLNKDRELVESGDTNYEYRDTDGMDYTNLPRRQSGYTDVGNDECGMMNDEYGIGTIIHVE